ncbi:MAG: lytic transglycosylase domain-containing protein [Ruminococcus sp.]|nr:lytic transglycosylase domain-containing protein [Ruminococcus sp.]
MAENRRVKKNNGCFANFLLWIISLAVLAGAVMFFVSNFYVDTKDNFEKTSYPQEYSEYVNKAAKEYELEPALIFAVIRTESGFNESAVSNAGAYGIMQVMPSSFEWLQEKRGVKGKYKTEDLLKPEICIDYGCYLLKFFYDYYGTEQCAVAAYNAGFVVSDWLENSEYSPDGKKLENIPYPETSNYVERVENAKEMYIKLYYS